MPSRGSIEHACKGLGVGLGGSLYRVVQGFEQFELHGVTLPIEVPIEVTAEARDGAAALEILARFSVKLSDYKISRPR